LLQLNELDEFRHSAYENAKLYKKRAKKWHDIKIASRVFEPGQKVLLFNSRLKLFPEKLKSRWSRPFVVTKVLPYGHVELQDRNSDSKFIVNGQRKKHYLGDELLLLNFIIRVIILFLIINQLQLNHSKQASIFKIKLIESLIKIIKP